MKLGELADLLFQARLQGKAETLISGLEMDSRNVQQGDLYVCIRGKKFDGHQYAAEAEKKGAVALLVEEPVDSPLPQIICKDTRYAMALFASHFYGYPSKQLNLIGITGTNGKTTTSYIIEQLLRKFNKQSGLMGTIQMKIGDEVFGVKNTTQESHKLQQSFRKMVDAGCDYCVMEVSSHALSFGRVLGCDFRTAIFTNLTQDHLDYHGTMEKYLEAKSLLFSRLGNAFAANPADRKYAVLNADDPASEYLKQATAMQTVTYGLEQSADVKAADIRLTAQGTKFRLSTFAGDADIHMRLLGKFNVYNTLAAITAALIEGIPLADIAEAMKSIDPVEGRMELVEAGQSFLTIVDYAHTPDGLENVLNSVSEFAEGKILCVFGCGGDRDRSKRPVMGRIAARLSDFVIVTSDNPRTEDPTVIISDIVEGLEAEGLSADRYECIEDRKRAIEKAVEMASPGDVVLIMGKGHETYQEMNGERTFFDDRVVAENALRSIIH